MNTSIVHFTPSSFHFMVSIIITLALSSTGPTFFIAPSSIERQNDAPPQTSLPLFFGDFFYLRIIE